MPKYYDDEDHAYFLQVTQEMQSLHTTTNYLSLAQTAFRVCVHSFLHSEITDREEKCIAAVSKKYIAASVRATSRLAELQSATVRTEREGLEARLKGQ